MFISVIWEIELIMLFQCGWYAHPVYSKVGGYPPIMVESIAERSQAEGRAWSRLPYMSAEARDSIRGWQIETDIDRIHELIEHFGRKSGLLGIKLLLEQLFNTSFMGPP